MIRENALKQTIKRFTPTGIRRAYRKLFPANGISHLTPQMKKLKLLKETGERFQPVLPDFPPMVRIETTTRCNLACTHCPNSVLSGNPDFLGDIDNELYFKIIDEIAAEAPDTVVRPFGGGEPLMKKDIAKLIKYASDKGVKHLGLNSNGLILIPKKRKELIEAGLSNLEVSIDAATKEAYRKIRQSDLFDRVVANTLAYIEESKAYNPSNIVTVSFVLQNDNRAEVDQFRDFWTGKADDVLIRDYHHHNELVDDHGRFKTRDFKYRPPCPFLWYRMSVHTDGTAKFCEYDWEGKHGIGDLKTHTIKEIWHGERLNALRREHVCGTFDYPFCNSCRDWKEVRWPTQY